MLPVNADFASIRGVRAREHAHQRAFAGPIAANQADHLARTQVHRHVVHRLPHRDALLHCGDDRAVAWSGAIHEIGGDTAGCADHVLEDELGIARDVLAEMAADETRVGIVAATRIGRDDHANAGAAVEIRDRIGAARTRPDGRGEHRNDRNGGNQSHLSPHAWFGSFTS